MNAITVSEAQIKRVGGKLFTSNDKYQTWRKSLDWKPIYSQSIKFPCIVIPGEFLPLATEESCRQVLVLLGLKIVKGKIPKP